jgi:hypothetical protein
MGGSKRLCSGSRFFSPVNAFFGARRILPWSRGSTMRFKDAERRLRRLPSAILEPHGPSALNACMAGTGKRRFQPNQETWQ